ncbi:ABC transporter permease [Streptomyces sp. NPDC091217]|uniref:ABC transporter permease n=1 Tax=Streptomyces sp. NPDC091217 TaxID=3365975 RepID=UPI0038006DC3
MTPIRSAVRFARIVSKVTSLNLRARLEYRAEFLISVLTGAIWQTSTLVFATVLLVRFPGVGGWSAPQVLLLASMRLTSHGLFVLLFGRVLSLSLITQEGWIETFLLRPIPVHRQVQLSSFSVNAIGDLLVSATLLTLAVYRFDLPWTPFRIGMMLAGLAGGCLVEAAIHTAISAAAFRYASTAHWNYWVEEITAIFGNYPLRILPGALEWLLTYILPLGFIAYIPAAVVTGNSGDVMAPHFLVTLFPLVGLMALIGARVLWNLSLRNYQGVSA